METISVTNLDIVTSTSDHLLDAAKAGAPEGTAVRANVQTKGRGRQGRDWVSPRGSLYVSILLRPERPMHEWPSLSLVAGLSLYDAITTYRSPADMGLKWPNDVLYHQRKCAGLLLEVHDKAILLGCGVNLHERPVTVEGWPPISLNEDAADTAILDADKLMTRFSETLCARYKTWCDAGFMPMREDWLDAAAHYGQDVQISRHGDMLEGKFHDLDPAGGLCLIDDDGVHHTIAQGDVTRARVKTTGVEDAVSD